MKLKTVQLINGLSKGHQTLTNTVSGAQPGQIPGSLSLTECEGMPCVLFVRPVNGVLTSTHIPMTNVASFQVLEEPKAVEPKTPAPAKK